MVVLHFQSLWYKCSSCGASQPFYFWRSQNRTSCNLQNTTEDAIIEFQQLLLLSSSFFLFFIIFISAVDAGYAGQISWHTPGAGSLDPFYKQVGYQQLLLTPILVNPTHFCPLEMYHKISNWPKHFSLEPNEMRSETKATTMTDSAWPHQNMHMISLNTDSSQSRTN